MKAIVYTRYGPPDVLHLEQVATPVAREHEIQVKVQATTVTIGDTIMRSLNTPGPGWQRIPARLYLGLLKPKRPILGMELAGDVTAVGSAVTHWQVGDAVIASTFGANFGAHAEYKCLPEDGIIALKPANLSYEEAAAIPGGGMTALRCLRRAKIQRGQKVLVYGASGAVGTDAVQLARHHFHAEVTGVCSTRNLELVRSLGADHVIDYTQENFTQRGEAYDVIFDAVGKLDRAQATAVLAPTGIYLNVLKASEGKERREDLIFLTKLAAIGALKPSIDRWYTLEQIAEAHAYVEQGHKRGNVVISMAHD